MQFPVPPVEFTDYCGGSAVVPTIPLSSCERIEKERIVRLDDYSLTVTNRTMSYILLFLINNHPELN